MAANWRAPGTKGAYPKASQGSGVRGISAPPLDRRLSQCDHAFSRDPIPGLPRTAQYGRKVCGGLEETEPSFLPRPAAENRAQARRDLDHSARRSFYRRAAIIVRSAM